MVRWLEKSGYDVSYCTDVDTHESHRVVTEVKRISIKVVLSMQI